MTNKLKIGEKSRPRFEFRTFGSDFSEVAHLMSRLSVPVPEKFRKRYSSEIYIVSRTNDINNCKIRDGKMDIKTLILQVEELEQWAPLMKGKFPMKCAFLEKDVFPAFQVEISKPKHDEITLDEFLTIVKTHPELKAVTIEKERFGYMVNNTICEFARVWINGTMIFTISSESTDVDDVKKTIEDLGLNGMENINYMQAIKRVIGMVDKKLAN